MHKTLWVAVVVLVLAGSTECAYAEGYPTTLVLPQVAKGEFIETVIVFLNGAATTTEIAVTASDPRLLSLTSEFEYPYTFELGPYERREMKIEGGGELITGAMEIRAPNSLSVEGRILRRLPPDGEIVSQVTVLAQPPHTELIIPVSHGTNGIDNTGIALYVRGRFLKAHLYDAAGNLVTESETYYGELGSPPPHSARFIDEMFAPSLLGDHFTGALRLESSSMGLAATALYTRGADFWTAQVQEVKEAKGHYSFRLKPGVDVNIVGQLQAQYGFQLVRTDWGPSWIISCTEDVARALYRDPRIE